MISQQEHCLNILETLSLPGGQSKLKSNNSNDPFRPLVSIDILKGKEHDYKGRVSLKINGLKLTSGDSVFGSDCFDFNCFDGSGIWTTAIITPNSMLIDGVTHYWVSGDKDENGFVYNVDIGYLYVFGEPIIVESNIPVINNNIVTSTKIIDIGIKFIKLKKISIYSAEDILYTYGDFKQPPLLRSTNKSLLKYNNVDQKCDIEDIAITVIQLLTTNYYRKRQNQYLYRAKKYVEPSIISIIENNLSRLSTLINKDVNSLRYGSIPRYVATYTKTEDIYGTKADKDYIDKTLTCFEDECFTPTCFEIVENKLLVSRLVDTRAMAWVLYAYCTYSIVFANHKYDQEIEDITTYLVNQQDKTGLLTDGWLHNDIYDEAEQITIKSTSTNIISCLALLKAYDLNNSSNLIDLSTDLYEIIINTLYYNNQGIFVTAYDNEAASIESITYGLLLANAFNRPDIINKLNESIAYKFKNGQGSNLDYITLTNRELLTDTQLEIYLAAFSEDKTLSLESDSSFIYPFTINEAFNLNLADTIKYNILLFNISTSINKKGLYVPFINQINSFRKELTESQKKDSNFKTSSILTADCITEEFIFDNDFVKIESIDNVKSLLFYRSFIYDKVKAMWPREYTWPSEAGLSLKGNLGKILYSVSRTLGNWYIDFNNLIKSRNIKSSTFTDLDNWGNDYNLNKRYRETKEEYKKRLSSVINKPANTKSGIEENLKAFEVEVEIKDTWKDIVITSDYTTTAGNNLWGEGILSGPNYAKTNRINVVSKQPFNKEAYKELRNSMASGIALLVTEKLNFNVDSNANFIFGPSRALPETPTNIIFRLTTSELDFGCILFINELDAVILETEDYIILNDVECGPPAIECSLDNKDYLLLEDCAAPVEVTPIDVIPAKVYNISAGVDQFDICRNVFTLTGVSNAETVQWVQINGPTVTINNSNQLVANFVKSSEASPYEFKLIGNNDFTLTDTVKVETTPTSNFKDFQIGQDLQDEPPCRATTELTLVAPSKPVSLQGTTLPLLGTFINWKPPCDSASLFRTTWKQNTTGVYNDVAIFENEPGYLNNIAPYTQANYNLEVTPYTHYRAENFFKIGGQVYRKLGQPFYIDPKNFPPQLLADDSVNGYNIGSDNSIVTRFEYKSTQYTYSDDAGTFNIGSSNESVTRLPITGQTQEGNESYGGYNIGTSKTEVTRVGLSGTIIG